MSWRYVAALAGIGILVGSGADITGQTRPEPPVRPDNSPPDVVTDSRQYVRVTRENGDQLAAFETAISRFVAPDSDLTVDLIGAIHVADRSYFEELNHRFRDYDAVLYELIAPAGTRIPRGGIESESVVSYMQGGMTKALELAFQLDCIDYTGANLVHADMSPTEFSRSMQLRGETVGKTLFRMIGQSIVQQSHGKRPADDLRILSALFSENREYELKCALAEQFADLNGAMLAFSGPHGSTLVTERNKKALTILRREMGNGKRKLAIFFGAGHMSDLSHRLRQDFGLQVQGTEWIRAWDSSPPERGGEK